jgi:hypothetical protein
MNVQVVQVVVDQAAVVALLQVAHLVHVPEIVHHVPEIVHHVPEIVQSSAQVVAVAMIAPVLLAMFLMVAL